MKFSTLAIILSIVSLTLSAQNAKKGFKSLEKSDYAKAKDAFEKNLSENKDHVASNFGEAMILADEKSPYFNIVDSWGYIEKVKGKTNELSQEELEILSEYFNATEARRTSYPIKKKIDNAIEAVESRLIKYIREENDLEAVYAVLEKYPDYRHYDNVVHIRNQFEYRKYEKLNTFDGYVEFIEKFPDAAQVPKAERNRDKMAFEKAKTDNTVLSYNTFIKQYPGSVELQQAIKLRNEAAFANAKIKNTLLAYEGFINLYPDALQIPEAKKYQRELMYEKAKRIKSLEAYNEFIRMYPEGGYYVDVFNLKSEELGKNALESSGFSSVGLKWARALDNNEQIDLASSFAATSDGGLIIAGTTQTSDTNLTDAWIIKIDAAGKMVWEKTIGQQYNDIINKIHITPDNEIICVGKTQVASDSAKYVAWVFMLGEDGSRTWNKNLGAVKIATSELSPKGRLYLSTYKSDTIAENLYIQALNHDGQMIWDRDYTRKGVFNGIGFTGDDHVILAGSNWLTYNDPKFYIQWEDTLKIPGNYIKLSHNNQYVNLISSNEQVTSLINYNLKGEKLGQSTVSNNADVMIDAMEISAQNNVLFAVNERNSSTVKKYSLSGSEVSEFTVNPGYKVVAIIKNKNGGINYLLKGDDYVILSYSSEGF